MIYVYLFFPDVSLLSVQEGYWLIHFVPRNCSTPHKPHTLPNSLHVKSTAFLREQKTICPQQATGNSAVWKGFSRRFRAMKCDELDHLNPAWNESYANLRLFLSFIHILVIHVNKKNMKSQHLIKQIVLLYLHKSS